MTSGFTARRQKILNLIVSEYIKTAVPVASEFIFRNYNLGVSPATIRNDMVFLEEESYITRPHTSAGCIPLDKGYRHYVESISSNIELPLKEQQRIRDLFFHAEEEINRWLKLAAVLMARLVGNAALVTFPKASQCRFKHLELVSLHELLSMMVLVFQETLLKQQLLSFSEPVTQEQLNSIAQKINTSYEGLTSSEILAQKSELTTEEQRVTEAVVDIMSAEDEMEYSELYLEGLRLMLGQPEFVKKDRILNIMELMEARDWLKPVLQLKQRDQGVQVVIGEESPDIATGDLSLVISRYGIPQRASGTISVIGPTRMDYRRAISTVGYMSGVLSELVAGVCHEE
jgi:heat-inducible transcriptional repressor